MDNEYLKPLPAPDHLTAPFWDGCKAHKLLLQRCKQCSTSQFPPGPLCTKCRSAELEWSEASGKAKVFSWIVVRHPIPADVYKDEVPYVVALVDLDEGPRMSTNIVDCVPESIKDGMPVEVAFKQVSDAITLPLFRPAK